MPIPLKKFDHYNKKIANNRKIYNKMNNKINNDNLIMDLKDYTKNIKKVFIN